MVERVRVEGVSARCKRGYRVSPAVVRYLVLLPVYPVPSLLL